MEVAVLIDQRIEINKEWFEQLSTGASRESVVRNLEEKYRIHSNKKVIECPCCSQPVTLVLRGETPHFRHRDPCPSAENYERYITRIKKSEDNITHRAGRAILRTYLEGQLKPQSIIVQDGYMCRSSLKIVPDFILTFPDGSIWAIDYITGSREDEAYNNYIQKRTETYRAAGFKPFFFIDFSWLATVPERKVVSFYKAEQQMKIQTETDVQWTAFMSEFIDVFGKAFVLREYFGIQQHVFERDAFQSPDVYSLAYVDPGAGNAYIQRFIPVHHNKFGYHVHRSLISLERATSLDHLNHGFTWWDNEETEIMQQRLQILSSHYEREVAIAAEKEELKWQQQELNIEVVQQNHLVNDKFSKHTTVAKNPEILASDIELMNYLFSDNIRNLFHIDMSLSEALHILTTLRANKNLLSRIQMERIRSLAREVMGPIKYPNSIDSDLRRVLIDIAML
ncbi:hypothetical protein OB236_14580 [Paenibacillus sp. WQ 127069]|uniref:Competence protein CoiA n=1 Tax=Paenibacillus baimaensis TaxID=2982185 RepID=A0ABT2UFB7_9BACL|nr:hypothetical protein [Paenibacillus sp. WQ 127069]MCU6793337.1 hypothetical protein [Paenibacillus sp. WQ 127069]